MAIKMGSNDVDKIYLGANEINKMYLGSDLVYDAAAWSPLDLPNLEVWLDASDDATITEVGGEISQWDDKSGNANHAVQATPADQCSTTTYNGLSAIDSQLGEFFNIPVARNEPYTLIMAVVQKNAIPAKTAIFSDDDFSVYLDEDNFKYGLNDERISVYDSNTDNFEIIVVKVGSGGKSLEVNEDSTALTGSYDLGSPLYFGEGLWVTGQYFLLDFILTTDEMSSGDITLLKAYFNAKWVA